MPTPEIIEQIELLATECYARELARIEKNKAEVQHQFEKSRLQNEINDLKRKLERIKVCVDSVQSSEKSSLTYSGSKQDSTL